MVEILSMRSFGKGVSFFIASFNFIRSPTVRVHFDRRVEATNVESREGEEASDKAARISQHGAWSTMGRRQSQEDAFVLHEIKYTNQNKDTSSPDSKSVLLMGVFGKYVRKDSMTNLYQLHLLLKLASCMDRWSRRRCSFAVSFST